MRFVLRALACGLLVTMAGPTDAAPGDAVYARPGQRVPANGTRLNLYCLGSGAPTVVFDSGFEDWAPAWAVVQPRVAKWTRACSYDRAGAGFSDPGPMPRTSVRIADELKSALEAAKIRGPYILVGHAFGGDNVRTFAVRHPADVAGLVMVEADATDFEPPDMQADDHRGNARGVAQLRACREAVAAGRALPPLATTPGRAPRTCAQQFFRGLPEAEWSGELNAKLLELAQTKVELYDAFISEIEEMANDEAYLKAHPLDLGSRPIRVLSSGNHGVGSLPDLDPPSLEHLRYEYETTLAQSRWLKSSTNSKQIFAHHSSEYIQFDEPGTVVDAIREVFDLAQSGNRPAQ